MPMHDKDCKWCRSTELAKMRIRKKRHLRNKAFDKELKAAKKAGKVVTLFDVDEFTGIHFRIDKHNQLVMGGRGRYNVN